MGKTAGGDGGAEVLDGGCVAEEVVEGCGQGGHSSLVSPFCSVAERCGYPPGGTWLSKVFESFGLSLDLGDGSPAIASVAQIYPLFQ